MREQLSPFKNDDNINYLCIVMVEMLGEFSLASAPALCSGFSSVTQTLRPEVATALANLRHARIAPHTLRELRYMIAAYEASDDNEFREGRQRRQKLYRLGEDLSISRSWTDVRPPVIDEVIAKLSRPLAPRQNSRAPVHDAARGAEIVCGDDEYSSTVDPLGFNPGEAPAYGLDREQVGAGVVEWSALIDMANEFDAIDVRLGRQQAGERTWFGRLHDARHIPSAELLVTTRSGLEPAQQIDLRGLKHLIGLPGAGKTTILYLLAAVLADSGRRVCFLFPSVEVASGFVETLERYGREAALLYGRGDRARATHVQNFAASLASQNNGYAVTRSVASAFSTNCSLASWASDEDKLFPHLIPPCDSLQQKPAGEKKAKDHRCALSSMCGRLHVDRKPIRAPIWATHVLSLDRDVPGLFSEHRIKLFEYIARTFDLLVVDECDGAQSALDNRGTPIVKLTGSEDSLALTMNDSFQRKAAGPNNEFLGHPKMGSVMTMTNRFASAGHRLQVFLASVEERLQRYGENKLHTTSSILAQLYPVPLDATEEQVSAITVARAAIEKAWDHAAKSVVFRGRRTREAALLDEEIREEDEERYEPPEELIASVARDTGVTIKDARAFYEAIRSAILRWDTDEDDAQESVRQALRDAPGLRAHLAAQASFDHYAVLLVAVSQVVLEHFGLAPHLRMMNSEGMIGDEIFESRLSHDAIALVPEALVGRLSGIRYTVSERKAVSVAHVAVAGTPRLLPQRMRELSLDVNGGEGMSVLFTSATSLLAPSPSFHVDVGPHYVLRRPNTGNAWAQSEYRLLPLRDPRDPSRMLRFSGSGMSFREHVLRAMVDGLLDFGEGSHIEIALRKNDVVSGIRRRAAFVVNSYDQCELIYQHIRQAHASWASRTRYLVRWSPSYRGTDAGVTAGTVERLSQDPNWDLLIFPMSAIGRGVNIVFPDGPRANQAMIGSLFFLTRPHPSGDSLQLIQGLIGRASAAFDRQRFSSKEEALSTLWDERRAQGIRIRNLLRQRQSMATMQEEFALPFVADQMIIILQTIGRAMRGDRPAYVSFVDSAWAPRSAEDSDKPDTARTSMLLRMRQILAACLSDSDPALRECYENLYRPFMDPLSRIEGLEIGGA